MQLAVFDPEERPLEKDQCRECHRPKPLGFPYHAIFGQLGPVAIFALGFCKDDRMSEKGLAPAPGLPFSEC